MQKKEKKKRNEEVERKIEMGTRPLFVFIPKNILFSVLQKALVPVFTNVLERGKP